MRVIAAISTPPGRGGIGIVRLSGSGSLDIISKIFTKKISIPRHMYYGNIIYDGKKIDEVLVCYFKAPNSYTTEDMIEIYCHGGYVSCMYIMEILLKLGCVEAGPGEFTKLAFLNGRIDLLEAEAIKGIIEAETKEEHLMYSSILSGSLSFKLMELLDLLIDLISECEAKIDYPELGDVDSMIEKIDSLILKLKSFLDDEKRTTYVREGLKLAIIGRPNVGKSSLLNALTNKERAIVTEIPGTTRDTIHEFINYDGLNIHLIDTAGIRDTDEIIEKQGILQSKKYALESDFVILMIDGSDDLTDEDFEILDFVKDKDKIILVNKEDKGIRLDLSLLQKYGKVHVLSVKEDRGIRELMKMVKDMVIRDVDFNLTSIFNIRHRELLESALAELIKAREDTNLMPFEIVEVSLREALEYINMILGRDTSEDIIDRVFQDFCVGK